MRKKLLFFLYSLSGGGAERTVINIINNLDEEKYEVILVLGTQKNNDYIHLLNEDVQVEYLNSVKLRYCLFKLVKSIRHHSPDLLFSTMNGNNIILLLSKILALKKTPIIVREASNRSQSGTVTQINRLITKILYNYLSNQVIALSKGVKNDLVNNFKVKEGKIDVIYNPIEVEEIQNQSIEEVIDIKKHKEEKLLIAVGRLVQQKDFNTLIKAFSRISQEVNSRLIILGKGPKEEELRNLAKKLEIEDKILFLGFKQNPYKYLRYADVFVLSSKWEGFGHVIVEAMASGTPVISTNCHSGPDEIIQDDRHGILVPVGDEKELAQKAIILLKDQKMREKLTINSRERAKDFDVKRIVAQYERKFINAIYNK